MLRPTAKPKTKMREGSQSSLRERKPLILDLLYIPPKANPIENKTPVTNPTTTSNLSFFSRYKRTIKATIEIPRKILAQTSYLNESMISTP